MVDQSRRDFTKKGLLIVASSFFPGIIGACSEGKEEGNNPATNPQDPETIYQQALTQQQNDLMDGGFAAGDTLVTPILPGLDGNDAVLPMKGQVASDGQINLLDSQGNPMVGLDGTALTLGTYQGFARQEDKNNVILSSVVDSNGNAGYAAVRKSPFGNGQFSTEDFHTSREAHTLIKSDGGLERVVKLPNGQTGYVPTNISSYNILVDGQTEGYFVAPHNKGKPFDPKASLLIDGSVVNLYKGQ